MWEATVLFWGTVTLAITKVMGDIGTGTIRRELLALAVGAEVAVVIGIALVMVI
jgi:hypothetical protein